MVEGICREYAEDLGGNPTTGQIILLAEIKKLLVYMALVDEHIAEIGGPFKSKGELHPALSGFYLSCSNGVQRAVERLGLKRVDRGEDVLEKYLAANYPPKTQASIDKRGAIHQEAPGATISEPNDQEDGKDDESPAAPAAQEDGAMGEEDVPGDKTTED